MKKRTGLPILLEKRKSFNFVKLILTVFVFVFVVSLSARFGGGQGTEDDPYIITTHEHLNNIKWTDEDGNYRYLAYHFRQNADIIFTEDMFVDGGVYHNNGEGWVPIGYFIDEDDYALFTGTYDGNGHIIDGLFINRVETAYQGLFGRVEEAAIKNLGLINVNITGANLTAALVGRQDNNSTTINCYSTGTITGVNVVGGLVGRSWDNSTIDNCFSSCTVTGGSFVGGLAGSNQRSSIISNSYAIGNVTGTTAPYSRAGGLVGINRDPSIIENCYSLGNVEGITYVGGLVGQHHDGAIIRNCYSRSNVTGNADTGGLIGINAAGSVVINSYSTGTGGRRGGFIGTDWLGTGTFTNNYWDTESFENNTAVGATGKTTMEMIYPEYIDVEDIYVDWDFDSGEVWAHDITRELNNGYPIIHFQGAPPPLDTPEVVIERIMVADVPHVRISWERIEDALSYQIYSSTDASLDDWGEPAEIVAGDITHYAVPIDEERTKFFYVVASPEEAP